MSEIIDRLTSALNEHDLDAMVALFHADYDSRQPAHPARAFVGRAQVGANCEAMFAGVPDLRVELIRSVQDGETTWCEWAWSGTRTDAQPFEVRGVVLFQVRDDLIIGATLYLEDVETEAIGIEQAVEGLSGSLPVHRDQEETYMTRFAIDTLHARPGSGRPGLARGRLEGRGATRLG